MTKLTKLLLEKNIENLEDAIHETLMGGGEMIEEVGKEVDRLNNSINEIKEILKEVE